MKVLFVCSQNRLRSLTAETVFDGEGGHQVRSAGTEEGARIRVTAGHLGWADLIFVMEKRHVERLQRKFREEISAKQVVCLHIPDDYEYMDEELIHRLRGGVEPHVDFGDDLRTREVRS
ncbi:MAG: protein tyrosine phosphatase [bacterium]